MDWVQVFPSLVMGSFLFVVLYAVLSDTPSIPNDCNIDEYYEEKDRLEKRRRLMKETGKKRKDAIRRRVARRR